MAMLHGTKMVMNAVKDNGQEVQIFISNRTKDMYTLEVDGKNYNLPCYAIRFAQAFLDACSAGDMPMWKTPTQRLEDVGNSGLDEEPEEPEESEGLDA